MGTRWNKGGLYWRKRKNFFTVRTVEPRNQLPEELVWSPSLKAFKTSGDKALSPPVWPQSWPCSKQDVGLETPPPPPKTSIIFFSISKSIVIKHFAASLKKNKEDLTRSDPLPPSGSSRRSRRLAHRHRLSRHLHPPARRSGAVARLSLSQARGRFGRHLTRDLPRPNPRTRQSTGRFARREPARCRPPQARAAAWPKPAAGSAARTDGLTPGVRPLSQR